MKRRIKVGKTDKTVLVFIPDPAATDGGGKTGLAHTDITVSYTRAETDNDVVVTDVTSSLAALTNLTDAHSDWGWKEVSNTLAPGLYRLDIADAVFAAGATEAVVYVMITSSAAAPSPMEFVLVNFDPDEAAVPYGVVDSGASTTSIPTSAFSPAGAAADQFAGRTILFDLDTSTAALRGQARAITASSNDAAPTLTVNALTTAPSAGDKFQVV